MRKLRTEKEIMQGWKGNLLKPIVSICCITYNHESYIEDGIEGFLIQETDFPFEILIHDDASTDNTANIVHEYAEKYPNIIKPIFQTENQYSKGIKVNSEFNFSRVKGEFVALCEGDDFWVAEKKLQTQVDVLKGKPDVSVVFHNAIEHNFKTERKLVICNAANDDSYISKKEAVHGRGGFMPTASIMFRSKSLDKINGFFQRYDAPIGDFFIQMILVYEGDIYYLNEPMCIYRRNHSGSWTNNHLDTGKSRIYACRMVGAINGLLNYLQGYKNLEFLASPFFFYNSGCCLREKSLIKKTICMIKFNVHGKTALFIVYYFLFMLKRLLRHN